MSNRKSKRKEQRKWEVEIIKEILVSFTPEEHKSLQTERVMDCPTYLLRKDSQQ